MSAGADPGLRSWEQLARQAARSSDQPARPAREFLCFELAGSPYALPVDALREISRLRPITPVPRTPEDVLGVVSLRGAILLVIDLRRRLSLPAGTPWRHARIAVLSDPQRGLTGLLVDRVRDVLRTEAELVRPASQAESGAVLGLLPRDERFVSVLDPELLLGSHA